MVAQVRIRPIVIGIHGKSASGKDTLAQFLIDSINRLEDELDKEIVVHKLAFADPLRAGASEMFNIDPDDFHDRELKDEKIDHLGMSPTKILQTIGQAMRDVNPDTWTAMMRERIRDYTRANEEFMTAEWSEDYSYINLVFIISDVRYPNEVDLVKSFFAEDKSPSGIMIWIKREDQHEVNRRGDHISERAIDDAYMKARADAIITNRRNDIGALESVANKLVDKYVRDLII